MYLRCGYLNFLLGSGRIFLDCGAVFSESDFLFQVHDLVLVKIQLRSYFFVCLFPDATNFFNLSVK